MPDPVVLEHKPRQPAQWTPGGPQRYRSFSVIAKSETDAKARLRSDKNVFEGIEYVDHNGERPDPSLVCLAIEATALTQLPIGSTGLIEMHAAYGYRSSVMFRRRSDPLTPPQYWVDRGMRSEVIDTDIDSEPIVNAADEVFDPPVTIQIPTETLVVEYWRSGANFLAVYGASRGYVGKTNSTDFKGANNVECMFCESITIDQNPTPTQTALYYFKHTARFQFRPNQLVKQYAQFGGYTEVLVGGWRKVLMNRGRRVISGENGGHRFYHQIHEADDIAGAFDPSKPLITDPVFLTANGQDIQTRPNYKIFKVYGTANFNQLGI